MNEGNLSTCGVGGCGYVTQLNGVCVMGANVMGEN